MQERGIVGLEARDADGAVLGRITGLVPDETGELTHVLVERGEGEEVQIPISALSLDPEADFATFDAALSDAAPGEHEDDAARPAGYAPSEGDVEDAEHDNQLVTEPADPDEAQAPEEVARESGAAGGFEDEASNTPESGYPRNDAYIDPDSGEVETDPALRDSDDLAGDVEDLVDGSGLEVRSAGEGVVELSGSASSREDLEVTVGEIMSLPGVLEVDTTDVEVP